VLASSAYRAGIEPRSSAPSAYRALGALLAPFERPTQLTLRPRAAEAGFRFADVVEISLLRRKRYALIEYVYIRIRAKVNTYANSTTLTLNS